MSQTPGEIRGRVFRRVLRGYDPAEIKAHLDGVASTIERLEEDQNGSLRRITELETRLKDYQAIEKVLHETLMQAQETSGKSVENARREAQLIIQEAELKAAQILEKARHDLTTLKEKIIILRAKKESIVTQLKMLLTSELDLITAIDVEPQVGAEKSSPPDLEPSRERLEIEDIIKSLDL